MDTIVVKKEDWEWILKRIEDQQNDIGCMDIDEDDVSDLSLGDVIGKMQMIQWQSDMEQVNKLAENKTA